MALHRRSKKSKLLNSILIIFLMLLVLVSVPQIGTLIGGLLVLFLCCWLVLYNQVSYNRLFTNLNNDSPNIETEIYK